MLFPEISQHLVKYLNTSREISTEVVLKNIKEKKKSLFILALLEQKPPTTIRVSVWKTAQICSGC